MKDLEKIKSEDLGCQVQDANPGNFAIEQEVAQLVGATVPAPTEPSADDARELGAQLLVFLRRALLPIRSALRTALSAIYAHLDSRCTDYTPAAYASYQDPSTVPPYDPMRPLTPRSVANLLTAITAFSARKISNGSAPNDGIKDGISLAHLLGDSSIYGAIPQLIDDNHGWTLTRSIDILKTLFPNTQVFRLGFKKSNQDIINSSAVFDTLILDDYEGGARIVGNGGYGYGVKNLYAPKMTWLNAAGGYTPSFGNKLVHLYAPKWAGWNGSATTSLGIVNCPDLVFAEIGDWTDANTSKYLFYNCPNLIEVRLNEQSHSLNLSSWNPTDKGTTFLQNFKEHIALRLTDQGSGKTLTLSQAVFDTIWNQDGTPKSTDPDSVIYQINKIIKTDKHWSVNRA